MTAGYQLGMMRLGMPDRLLKLDLKMSRRGTIHVRHAYGYALPSKKGDQEVADSDTHRAQKMAQISTMPLKTLLTPTGSTCRWGSR